MRSIASTWAVRFACWPTRRVIPQFSGPWARRSLVAWSIPDDPVMLPATPLRRLHHPVHRLSRRRAGRDPPGRPRPRLARHSRRVHPRAREAALDDPRVAILRTRPPAFVSSTIDRRRPDSARARLPGGRCVVVQRNQLAAPAQDDPGHRHGRVSRPSVRVGARPDNTASPLDIERPPSHVGALGARLRRRSGPQSAVAAAALDGTLHLFGIYDTGKKPAQVVAHTSQDGHTWVPWDIVEGGLTPEDEPTATPLVAAGSKTASMSQHAGRPPPRPEHDGDRPELQRRGRELARLAKPDRLRHRVPAVRASRARRSPQPPLHRQPMSPNGDTTHVWAY